jgi:hypothetical protein
MKTNSVFCRGIFHLKVKIKIRSRPNQQFLATLVRSPLLFVCVQGVFAL